MRCDVNVSVRQVGQQALGTKVEVKNMNSFSGMAKAIDYEINRQVGSTGSVAICQVVCVMARPIDYGIDRQADEGAETS